MPYNGEEYKVYEIGVNKLLFKKLTFKHACHATCGHHVRHI
jgi:hypothetical protein